ncbi:MAG: DciA family protein [Burkholderiales bacterium]
MPSRSVRQLLESLPELKALTRGARRLLLLQQSLEAKLPSGLCGQVGVAGLSSGTLVILAANGTVGAKLRQLAPRLLTHLRRQDPEINAIRIRAQVRAGDNSLRQKQISLSPQAFQALSGLARQLHPSPLQQAIKRLANRGSRSSDY